MRRDSRAERLLVSGNVSERPDHPLSAWVCPGTCATEVRWQRIPLRVEQPHEHFASAGLMIHGHSDQNKFLVAD
jgi:hypothetical protein